MLDTYVRSIYLSINLPCRRCRTHTVVIIDAAISTIIILSITINSMNSDNSNNIYITNNDNDDDNNSNNNDTHNTINSTNNHYFPLPVADFGRALRKQLQTTTTFAQSPP